jgi:hypothetical protein
MRKSLLKQRKFSEAVFFWLGSHAAVRFAYFAYFAVKLFVVFAFFAAISVIGCGSAALRPSVALLVAVFRFVGRPRLARTWNFSSPCGLLSND